MDTDRCGGTIADKSMGSRSFATVLREGKSATGPRSLWSLSAIVLCASEVI